MKPEIRALVLAPLLIACVHTNGQNKPTDFPDTSRLIKVSKKIRYQSLIASLVDANIQPFCPKLENEIMLFDADSVSIGCALNKIALQFNLRMEFRPPNNFSFSRIKQKDPDIRRINGKIIDESGEPIVNASISTPGSNKTNVSGPDGFFEFTPQVASTSFEVTCIGYTKKTFKAGTYEPVTVMLTREYSVMNTIDSKVQKRISFDSKTASFSLVNASGIQKRPELLQALKGNVSGVWLTSRNGFPNASPDFSIRAQVTPGNYPGVSNIAKNDPLVLVNGTPLPSGILAIGRNNSALGDPTLGGEAGGLNILSFLNQEDIASITVLKDADAIAAYGTRGANGVILITTRNANAGNPPQLSLKLSRGIHQSSRVPQMLNNVQNRELREAYLRNGGLPFDNVTARDFFAWDPNRNINWSNDLVGNIGQSINFHLSVSGGDALMKFTAGVGYFRQTSVLPVSFPFSRLTQYLTCIFTPGERIRFNIDINAGTADDELPINNPMDLIRLAPNAPYPYKNGQLVFEENNLPFINPYGAFRNKFTSSSSSLLISTGMELDLSPSWQFKLQAGGNLSIHNEENKLPIAANPILVKSAYFETSATRLATGNIEPKFQYTRYFNGRRVKLQNITGLNYQERTIRWNKFQSGNLSHDSLMKVKTATPGGELTNGAGKHQVLGLVNQVFIDLPKFNLSLTSRFDKNRILSINQPVLFSGAIGAAWNFTREKNKNNTPRLIREGILKLTVGKIESDGSLNYGFMQGTDSMVSGETLIKRNRKFGEKTYMSQFTLNMNVQGWLTVSAAYYHNYTKSKLNTTNTNDPAFPFGIDHTSLVRNNGLEIELEIRLTPRDDKYWICRVLLNKPWNNLISFSDLAKSNFKNLLVVGEPLSAIRGYLSNGFNPSSNLFDFIDINQDGKLSFPEDIAIIGNLQPKLFGSMINSFKLKNFSLNLVLEGRMQQLRSAVAPSYDNNLPGKFNSGGFSNHSVAIHGNWELPPQPANRSEVKEKINSTKNSEKFLDNANALTLSAVKLSYRIPANGSRKFPLSSAQIYCEVQNAITISKYKYADPTIISPNGIPSTQAFIIGFIVSK